MIWEEIDELRPPAVGTLLTIWQESQERTEDPLERGVLCNAQVLALSCFKQGQRVFENAQDVLQALTGRQMETLLYRLMDTGGPALGDENPQFDAGRFAALQRK